MGDARWELNGVMSADQLRNPNDPGWVTNTQSHCTERTDDPDRVLLVVGLPPTGFEVPADVFGVVNEDAWAEAIEDTVAVIRSRFLSVRNIVLQPLVGGPNHEDCFIGDERAYAPWIHGHADNAIETVAARDANVVAGISPEVRTCNDYRDIRGHLTEAGYVAAAQAIGNFYRGS